MLNITKLILFIFLAVAMQSKAQTIEIVPQINYTFGGKIYGQFGEMNIQDSESYGISLDIVKDDVSFQLEYFYQPTTAEYREYLTQDVDEAELRINWYQIGVRKRFATDETVVPFGGASIGLTDFKLDSSPDLMRLLYLSRCKLVPIFICQKILDSGFMDGYYCPFNLMDLAFMPGRVDQVQLQAQELILYRVMWVQV